MLRNFLGINYLMEFDMRYSKWVLIIMSLARLGITISVVKLMFNHFLGSGCSFFSGTLGLFCNGREVSWKDFEIGTVMIVQRVLISSTGIICSSFWSNVGVLGLEDCDQNQSCGICIVLWGMDAFGSDWCVSKHERGERWSFVHS